MKKVLSIVLAVVLFANVAYGGFVLLNKNKEKPENNIVEISEEEKKVAVEYKVEKYERSTDNKALVISNSIKRPVSISTSKGEEIIKSINEILDGFWKDIIEETDKDIEEYDPDFNHDDIFGIEYDVTDFIINDTITFNLVLSGSMGGVSWEETYYYNYDLRTGKLLELEDICVNVIECKKVMKDYFLDVLQKDERFPELDEDYEANVEASIFNRDNYGLTKNGFAMIVQKYDIAAGVAGGFIYSIPYDEFNNYLKEEYRVEVTDLQS